LVASRSHVGPLSARTSTSSAKDDNDEGEEKMQLKVPEVNLLCVGKQHRGSRLAPRLITEITRVICDLNMTTAIYLATRSLHLPFTSARSWSRPLNISTFMENSGYRSFDFSQFPILEQRYSIAQFSAADARLATVDDIDIIYSLLKKDNEKYVLSTSFTKEEIAEKLLPKEGILCSYILTTSGGATVDFLSFYCVLYVHRTYQTSKSIKVAYLYYYTTTTLAPKLLLQTALKLAKENGCDEFRVTAVGDMQEVVVKDEEEQYFLFEKDISDLQYYLFNMNYPSLSPSQCKFIGIE